MEALFQKGYRIFNTPTSYNGTVLDHLAKHMMYLSTATTMLATYPNNWYVPTTVPSLLLDLYGIRCRCQAVASNNNQPQRGTHRHQSTKK